MGRQKTTERRGLKNRRKECGASNERKKSSKQKGNEKPRVPKRGGSVTRKGGHAWGKSDKKNAVIITSSKTRRQEKGRNDASQTKKQKREEVQINRPKEKLRKTWNNFEIIFRQKRPC